MKIYIDVGHGETGSDSGALGSIPDRRIVLRENEQNLIIALSAQKTLLAAGHSVTLSRTKNTNITTPIGKYSQADSNLIASANTCKTGTYDLMISIHNNSSTNTEAKGFQLFYKTGNKLADKSKMLADKISTFLEPIVSKNHIGTRASDNGEDYYGILRLHNKVGVLCECAFLSNYYDCITLCDKAEEIGHALAKGIIAYIEEQVRLTNAASATWYRVRKTWPNASTQLGAYQSLQNAKDTVDKNPGYYVFDEKGTAIYPIPEEKSSNNIDYKKLYLDLIDRVEAAIKLLEALETKQ